MNAHVKLIFPANAPGRPSWPYMDYDVEKKRDEVLAALHRHLPQMDFSADILRSAEEAEKLVEKNGNRFDGYLVYKTALWTKIEQVFGYIRISQRVICA